MLTKVSTKGQTVIPAPIREMACLEAGDELEVGYYGGMIILRKREAMDAKRVQALLLAGRRLPEMGAEDEAAVERALTRVRRKASR